MATAASGKGDAAPTPPGAASSDKRAPASTRANTKSLTPEEEVAARTADTDEKSSDKFVKVYTLMKSVPLTDEIHDANRVNTVREMIRSGLRTPDKSEVQYEGSEDAPDGESVYLTYSVTAYPAGRLPEDAPLNRVQVKPTEQPKHPGI
jgi:hypothetical protein